MKFIVSPALIRQYAVVVVVNLGVLTTGMSLTWPSPMIVKLRNGTDIPLSRPITEEEGSWIVSSGYLLAAFTNILGGMLLDVIGRKYCFLLASVPRLCMSIWFIFATEVWMLITGRIFMVIADSFVFVVVPVYASEIACKEHRGALGTFLQIFSSLGVVTTLSVGPFLSYTNFNIVFATAIALSTLPLLCLPDSPFYLYSKGRYDEALSVLTQIRGSDALAKEELEEYKQTKHKSQEKVDKIKLLTNKTFLKSLFLGTLLCGGAQLVGFNAVSFYLQTILESTRTSVKPEIASVIIGVIQVLASFCTTLIMNKFGRRTILISSLIGMFFGMMGLGTFFEVSSSEGYQVTGFMNYLPIISLILVIYCYSVGIGSLIWLVTAELFDGPARAFGVSTSLIACLLLIFVTTKYFAFMTSALGPASTYWFFSSMCVLITVLIALFMPETKGKSFAEIQKELGGETFEMKEEKNNVTAS